MTRPWGTRLLLLTIPLALVDSADLDKTKVKVLRELKKVSPSSANVRQCLWFAMQEFNRESAEKHLFQVVKVLQVHLQVTDCLEYLIEAEIARTNCRKLPNSNESCVPKENPRLEKIRRCTFLVGALPWHGDFTSRINWWQKMGVSQSSFLAWGRLLAVQPTVHRHQEQGPFVTEHKVVGAGASSAREPGFPCGIFWWVRLCPSLLLLVATVALASSAVHAWGTPKVVRKFQDIPKSYVYVQQAVWFAMKEYNKASSDKFAFKVVEILKSQEQITDSLDYLIEAKIVRTTCKKVSGEHENCSEQQDPQMQKLLEARGWGLQREVSAEDQRVLERYLPATVEYAVHEFNLRSQDENAYKVDTAMVFSTELQLTRTRCGKFDEDIDNCPFQGRPDVNNTVTCLFTISTEPWRTVFELLNNTCSEGLL
ncbi:hypothetical protein CB1_000573001 [Camelus ferus]|nr:hypothetical protein CB1_000573001 [Camelus ferus]